jgi:ferredoxin
MRIVHIEASLSVCEGHGLCAQVAPDIYDVDDAGFVRVRVNPVEQPQVAGAQAGADACPVAALRLSPLAGTVEALGRDASEPESTTSPARPSHATVDTGGDPS